MYTLLLGANFLLFNHLLQNDGASVHDLDTVSVDGGLVGDLGAVGGVSDKKAGESHQEAALIRRNEVTLARAFILLSSVFCIANSPYCYYYLTPEYNKLRIKGYRRREVA